MTTASALELRRFDPAHDMSALVDLICEVNRHDDLDWLPTVESLGFDLATTPRFDPARDAIVVEAGARLVAAGWTDWRERDRKIVHNFEIWVHPDHRRQGLGRRILAWLEARADASIVDGSGGSPDLPHVLGGGLIVANPASVAFAERVGYATIRYGFQMRRPLDEPIPEIPFPDGLEIRPVKPEHHRAIWDADVEAFLDHWEAGVRTEADFTRMFEHPDHDTAIWQVAWDGDQVAGCIMNNIYPDENAKGGIDIGWLDHVSVRRPWRGRGLASALVVRSLAVHRDRGMTVAALGVDAENPTGALGLYERFGFRPFHTWAVVRKAS
jgi:mycothiol synthase